MSVDDISKLRQDLASRLVTALGLPASVADGRGGFDKLFGPGRSRTAAPVWFVSRGWWAATSPG